MKPCEQCGTPFDGKGRFCRDRVKNCRQKWHREHTAPGTVVGLRQIKGGAWHLTVRYPDQPEVQNGDRVLVIKGD